jgi:hypothetical protein
MEFCRLASLHPPVYSDLKAVTRGTLNFTSMIETFRNVLNILEKLLVNNKKRFFNTMHVIIVLLRPSKVSTCKNICMYFKRVASSACM